MQLDFAVVDDIATQFHGRGRAPGLQIAVLADGKVAHFAGYGVTDCATGAVPAADRFFRIASMSKSFTAAAILQLRDRPRRPRDRLLALGRRSFRTDFRLAGNYRAPLPDDEQRTAK